MSYVDTAAIEEHIGSNLAVIQGGRGERRFERIKFADVQAGKVEWLVKEFLPATGVAIVYGPSTVGKSFFSIYLGIRIGQGKPVLGHKVRRAGTLYFVAEGQAGFRKRIQGAREKFKIPPLPFEIVVTPPNMREGGDVDAMAQAARDAGAEMNQEFGVGLGIIVIDTISATMPGGNENTGEDMSKYLANAHELAQRTGTLVVLIGHPGKDETKGLRGWSGQVGNSDAIIQILPDKEDPKLRVGMVEKLKDGEMGERFAYRLKSFDMGVDEDGDPVTTAYCAFEEPPPLEGLPKGERPEKLGDGPEIVLRALRVMLDDGHGAPAPKAPGVKSGQLAVTKAKLKERAIRIGFADADEKPDTVRKSFTRALEKLVSKQRVRIEGEFVWPV